jgi:anti-sigma factor RsiW
MKTDRYHAADDRLIALYFGDEEASADQRRSVRQHLHGCEACTWRYTELTAPLERLRQDASGEADEVFTPARLEAQRGKILARIAESAAPSRVIPFPAAAARLGRTVVRRPLARWVAAAAAAGILVGLMGGRLLQHDGGSPVAAPHAAPTVIAALPDSEVVTDSPTSAAVVDYDEVVMGEIERAVFGRQIGALSALDALTPRVRQEAVLASSVR